MPPPPRAPPGNFPLIFQDPIAEMAENNRERGASSIPCKDYDSNTDDFDSWILTFENAVNVATNAQTHARQQILYKQWLPLKLDNEAKAILEQVPAEANYADTISQLKELLIDEVEIYKWKSYQKTIVWDKKESFQALATRVKKAVDKYDKDLNAQGKVWAYFFRFRAALPKTPYQDQIDQSIPKDAKTIENAKELSLRVQMTQQNTADTKQVQFTGAAMADDRIHALELELAKLKVKDQERDQEDRDRGRRDHRDYQGQSGYPSRNQYRSPSRGRSGYDSRYQSPNRSKYSNKQRSPSPNRNRSPSFDVYGKRTRFNRDDNRYDDRNRRSSPRSRDQSPANRDSRPSSGRDYRDQGQGSRNRSSPRQSRAQSPNRSNRQSSQGQSRQDSSRGDQNYRAIRTADEDSDPNNWDRETLNAYIDTLVAIRNNQDGGSSRQEN